VLEHASTVRSCKCEGSLLRYARVHSSAVEVRSSVLAGTGFSELLKNKNKDQTLFFFFFFLDQHRNK
jgi:hypothetical protein